MCDQLKLIAIYLVSQFTMNLSNSPKETKKQGSLLIKKILKKEETTVISLKGNLGGGKTTFVQGMAQELGIKEDITSPTFVVYKKYKGRDGRTLYHFDAYRVEEKDMGVLGFKEIMEGKRNIIVIEWGERIENILPKKRIEVLFKFIDQHKRELIVEDKSDIIESDL